MPEAYTHIRIARAALAAGKTTVPCTAAYELGANGPDPLFVSPGGRQDVLRALGVRLHKEKCGLFLQALAHYAKTEAQRAYTMGFLTHYAADGLIHPYVTACTKQGMPFCKTGGHGYCEVAMDTLFHERDTGVRGVPVDDAAPRPAAGELAEICLLMRRALQEVFDTQVSLTQLSDAYRLFRTAHRLCYTPRGGKKVLGWLLDHTVARGTDYVQSHMTPCGAPEGGFPEQWEHPFTGQTVQAGPNALCLRAAQRSAEYHAALTQFWRGAPDARALAKALGANSYETGLPMGVQPARQSKQPAEDAAAATAAQTDAANAVPLPESGPAPQPRAQ